MTDNERANKVYLARLRYGDGKPRKFIHELPLPKHDISVGRKTPKSEFLLGLEKTQPRTYQNQYDESFRLNMENLYLPMFDVYVGNK